MKGINIITTLVLLFSTTPFMKAQERHIGDIELLEIDETVVTFRAEGIAEKKKDVIEVAKMLAFQKLFFEGVEGFNDDKKLLAKENKYWLENFFEGKRAPYNGFVKGAQLEGDPITLPTGQYKGYAIVAINYESLIRTLKANHLMETDEDQKKSSAPKPARKFGLDPSVKK